MGAYSGVNQFFHPGKSGWVSKSSRYKFITSVLKGAILICNVLQGNVVNFLE